LDQSDIGYLETALDLAERGRGCTSPNPIVGAVIVSQGAVLGQGWHAGVGLEHAEVAAMRDAVVRTCGTDPGLAGELDAELVRPVCAGATMYVTLEPCCTQGRTPPCTTALIQAGLARIVVAAIDPSPAVNGRGMEILGKAGISTEVAEGPVAHRAKRQNNGLRKTVTTGLPFVEYKYAMTLDGRIATDTGDSHWISSPESRTLVHQWRAWSDAVVVGSGTVATDDPTLTARTVQCSRQPLRVVVDSSCSLQALSSLVRTAAESPVLVVCGEQVHRQRLAEVQAWGCQTATVGLADDGKLDPQLVCKALGDRGVQTVLLEGGPRLAGAWWAAGVVDRLAAFVCPRVVSGRDNGSPLFGAGTLTMQQALDLQEVEIQRIGPDVLITGYTGGAF
jgi:diaminohydroxyphosphoribosylaminopyrimidine deaminase/5-amino-6-(5-phosphoribosylamino)uracil reductase